MADLTVLVPSRGRPEKVQPLVEAFNATCTADTELVFSIDVTDPLINDYMAHGLAIGRATAVVTGDNTCFVQALNRAAETVESFAVGFMGDDHMPRTLGWDAAYLEALREMETGIVYGNDLLQGQALPTQVAMTTDIVRALGYMAPPDLTHLYVDNFWRDLGRSAGCLRYLPDVIAEHRHPVAGKAQWDAGYNRVNTAAMFERDARAYEQYISAGELHSAVDAVRMLRHG